MQSRIVKHELTVGLFVGAAVIVGVMFFAKQSRERGLLDTQQVKLVVADGSGLEKGAPVLMRGIEVGEVSDIQLTDDHQVEVTCDIAPRFAKHVTQDAKASVVEPPLLGSTKVEILPGESTVTASTGQKLETQVQGSFMQRVDGLEHDVRGAIARVDSFMATAQGTMEVVDRIARKVDEGEGLVGRLLNDKKLADDAAAFLDNANAVSETVRNGKGAVAMALNDEQFATDLKGTSKDIRSIVGDVEEGKGTLGKLVKDPELADESVNLIKEMRTSLSKLNELNEEAKTSMGKVSKLLDTTDRTVGKVEGLLSEAGNVTKELADTLHRINTGKGTIAALLNDPALYKETKSLLKELRESVEDLREQAPINSFIGVVFSAF